MISPGKLDEVGALLHTFLSAEAEAGFPVLSLCPSSDVIRFLDYFATLPAPERDALLRSHARAAARTFFLYVPAVLNQIQELAMSDPVLLRTRAAMQSATYTMGLRHSGLRMTKQCLNDPMTMAMMAETRAKLDFTPRDDPPAALVPDPDFTKIIPAKAPLLRKLIDPAFKQMFATAKAKRPGGETVHSGVFEGTAVNVGIDYATRFFQIRYGVSIPDDTKTIYARDLSYDGLFAGGGGWDYLTEENAERSVRLLCTSVARMVRLRNAVRALL